MSNDTTALEPEWASEAKVYERRKEWGRRDWCHVPLRLIPEDDPIFRGCIVSPIRPKPETDEAETKKEERDE